ncbi:hypothetical protein ABIB40_000129 [Pedobacter sp. UYP30]|uniref:hypothetical protein n=1 Tax=Pedobacter sp. UYP30 TaxID=1756400 RepID=UPI0033931E1C
MDSKVKNALHAGIEQYAKLAKVEATTFETELSAAFELDVNFLDKTTSFDAVFDSHPKFESLREVYFDLLMINFFSNDVKKLEEDYLESEEWGKIEEETIDRGTELLNLLLYIKDCHDEDLEPDLEDFLKEFLLVEDDEFQDEFEIYEDLIDNQQLAEASAKEICQTASQLKLVPEMEDLFVPFMVFFSDVEGTENSMKELAENSAEPAFETAVYALITTINK